MGLSGIHQKNNSSEVWCIFRIGNSDLTEQTKKCTCTGTKDDSRNGVGADRQQEQPDQRSDDEEAEGETEDMNRDNMDDSFCSYRSSTSKLF